MDMDVLTAVEKLVRLQADIFLPSSLLSHWYLILVWHVYRCRLPSRSYALIPVAMGMSGTTHSALQHHTLFVSFCLEQFLCLYLSLLTVTLWRALLGVLQLYSFGICLMEAQALCAGGESVEEMCCSSFSEAGGTVLTYNTTLGLTTLGLCVKFVC